jgi:hypothetical protein
VALIFNYKSSCDACELQKPTNAYQVVLAENDTSALKDHRELSLDGKESLGLVVSTQGRSFLLAASRVAGLRKNDSQRTLYYLDSNTLTSSRIDLTYLVSQTGVTSWTIATKMIDFIELDTSKVTNYRLLSFDLDEFEDFDFGSNWEAIIDFPEVLRQTKEINLLRMFDMSQFRFYYSPSRLCSYRLRTKHLQQDDIYFDLVPIVTEREYLVLYGSCRIVVVNNCLAGVSLDLGSLPEFKRTPFVVWRCRSMREFFQIAVSNREFRQGHATVTVEPRLGVQRGRTQD